MLTGTLVTLTPLKESDAPQLFDWINDPELVRYNSSYKPVHWNNHLTWFENVIKDNQKVIFGIRAIKEDILIGVIQLIDINHINRNAELIIRIGHKDFLGRGYGRESLRLMINFAWQDLNLYRIWLRVFGSNIRAITAYKAVEFKEEGCMRQAAFINGAWEDVCIMGILKTENT